MFHLLLIQPLFNALILFYEYVTFGDLGLAVIALTIALRFALYPIFYKGIKSQMLMQRMQPEIQRIQKELKNDKVKQTEAMLALYKAHKTNPFSGLFYTFIQLPILFAVYKIFMTGITTESLKDLYPFVTPPAEISSMFLGIIDVSQPNWWIVIAATIASFVQSYMMNKQSMARGAAVQPGMKYMAYLAPVLTLFILPKLSAAIGLYWTTTAIFSIFQQEHVTKQIKAHEAK
jgi:YidC/Oxa1 family membrane protein insertase